MATSDSSAEQYRSRVLTGDLPEGFLQLDENRTTSNPTRNVQPQHAMYQPNVPMHVVTRIKVTVAQAKLAKNYGLTRMDPYCRIRIGHHVFETQTDTNGSTNPRWNKTITCPFPRNSVNSIYIEIFDENAFSPDSQIAWGLIKIKDDLPDGETHDEWYPLSGKQGEDKEGMINVVMSVMESTEPVPATPVMIFPQSYSIAPQVYYPPVPYAMPQQIPVSRPPPAAQVRPDDVKNIKDMFPDMDEEVIRSVLVASGGNVDAALNHLLSMNEK
ncbi:toll-interacting protein B-like [Dendronephthya gigantea]|uniref:toll-interacting protein B-like n=1 Tax=Dendronephthya gigantea TaxID=151771 RepID=UPI00106C3A50|nr:toll-interacting protein B-like [Dendronephthya gigantea]